MLDELIRYSNSYVLAHGCDVIEWSTEVPVDPSATHRVSKFALCRPVEGLQFGNHRSASAMRRIASAVGMPNTGSNLGYHSKSMSAMLDLSANWNSNVNNPGNMLAGSNNSEMLSTHETFYCCMQAALYICCFHGTGAVGSIIESEEKRRMWELVLTSSLQPLKFCLQSVQIEFLRLIREVDMLRAECWPLVACSRSSGGKERQSKDNMMYNPLDSFFPFDPCLLSAVGNLVERFYIHWVGIPGVDTHVQQPNEGQPSTAERGAPASADDFDAESVSAYSSSVGIDAGQASSLAMSLSVSNSFLENREGFASSMASNGQSGLWPVPQRRPRQCSIGSAAGSW